MNAIILDRGVALKYSLHNIYYANLNFYMFVAQCICFRARAVSKLEVEFPLAIKFSYFSSVFVISKLTKVQLIRAKPEL